MSEITLDIDEAFMQSLERGDHLTDEFLRHAYRGPVSPPSIEPIEVTDDTVYVVNEGGSGLRIRVTKAMANAARHAFQITTGPISLDVWKTIIIAALAARG